MKRVLILSNCCISNTESNGRIHSFLVKNDEIESIHNFYVRGNPDIDNVSYLTVAPKKALLSKITFGLINAKLNKPVKNANSTNSLSSKSKKVFYHWIRSFAYLNNRRIIKKLSNYIILNNIDTIYLWGCNAPFLYNYSWNFLPRITAYKLTFTFQFFLFYIIQNIIKSGKIRNIVWIGIKFLKEKTIIINN